MNRKEVYAYWNRRGHEVGYTPHTIRRSVLYVWKTNVVYALVRQHLPLCGWLLKLDLWNEGLLKDSWFDLQHCPSNDALELVGVDLGKSICHYAKERATRIHVVHADLNYLPFRARAFSFVLDLSTLDHVAPEEVSTIFNEVRRILNGVFLTIFHQEERVQRIMQWYYRLWRHVAHEERGALFRIKYFFNVAWVREGLKRLGFAVLSERPFNVGAWFPFYNSVLKRWGKLADIVNQIELQGFPFSSWLSAYWVIVAHA